MNIEALLKINGGKLKFRTVWKELGHEKPGRPFTQTKCQFCDNQEIAHDQAVRQWGRKGRRGKLHPISWVWIGPNCRSELKLRASAVTTTNTDTKGK